MYDKIYTFIVSGDKSQVEKENTALIYLNNLICFLLQNIFIFFIKKKWKNF